VVPLLDSLPPARLTNIAREAFLAQVCIARSESAAADEHARRAAAEVAEKTSTADLRRLARVLFRLNYHAMALPLLQRIADPTRFHPETRMLLDCAVHLGRHQIILDTCRSLREAGEGDRRLLDREIDLLQIYDRAAAIFVLEEFVARHPDDRLARLRLSALSLLSGRFDRCAGTTGALVFPGRFGNWN
jgi:hypothetical protein